VNTDQELELFRKRHELYLTPYKYKPVQFICQYTGAKRHTSWEGPDPWQCDALDMVADPDIFNVAIRSCHGVGKTALMSWAALWFFLTRWGSEVITTAPTFNKQVKDYLWGQSIHLWWSRMCSHSKILPNYFECLTTRLQPKDIGPHGLSEFWFAVGVASKKPEHIEGAHAPSILVEIDEAKTIPKPVFSAAQGMRTTKEPKLLVASTPGGPSGEYHKIFTEYRTTWKHLIQVRPESLARILGRTFEPPAPKLTKENSQGFRVYYSKRFPPEVVQDRLDEWGEDNPDFISRVMGTTPTLESNRLIRYDHIMAAEHRENCGYRNCGCDEKGPLWAAMDVAQYGRDRTIIWVIRGGKILRGVSIARTASETTSDIIETVGVGPDPKKPLYRDEVRAAEECIRIATETSEWLGIPLAGIAVDATGIGAGSADFIRDRGYPVYYFNFGAPPTDIPEEKEDRDWRQKKRGLITRWFNLKAQMGFALRRAFEEGHICLAELLATNKTKSALLLPLTSQLAGARQRVRDDGRVMVEDPDQVSEEDTKFFDNPEEAKRSPDHFHALMMAWWLASGQGRDLRGAAHAAIQKQRHGITRLGRPGQVVSYGGPSQKGNVGTLPQPVGKSGFGGPSRFIDRMN